MQDHQATPADERRSVLARWGRPGAFAAGGLVAGGLLAGSLSASAATGTPSTTPGTGGYGTTAPGRAGGPTGNTDPSQPQRSDEHLLTGTTADKVRAAALAKYPNATVVRIETDSDGVYEAHLTTAAGTPVTVAVNNSFVVTGTDQGGPGGHGGVPGSSSDQQPATGSTSSAAA